MSMIPAPAASGALESSMSTSSESNTTAVGRDRLAGVKDIFRPTREGEKYNPRFPHENLSFADESYDQLRERLGAVAQVCRPQDIQQVRHHTGDIFVDSKLSHGGREMPPEVSAFLPTSSF